MKPLGSKQLWLINRLKQGDVLNYDPSGRTKDKWTVSKPGMVRTAVKETVILSLLKRGVIEIDWCNH